MLIFAVINGGHKHHCINMFHPEKISAGFRKQELSKATPLHCSSIQEEARLLTWSAEILCGGYKDSEITNLYVLPSLVIFGATSSNIELRPTSQTPTCQCSGTIGEIKPIWSFTAHLGGRLVVVHGDRHYGFWNLYHTQRLSRCQGR